MMVSLSLGHREHILSMKVVRLAISLLEVLVSLRFTSCFIIGIIDKLTASLLSRETMLVD